MTDIDVLLTESRRFPPPPEFAANAHVSDAGIYDRAAADDEAFWAAEAGNLEWIEPWTRVLDWKPP
ncbi:MAG TPA: acetyl-coenzyme A synthetase N-terminal domain-containing protein, partial [Gemmatimonadaceae bacterium]|nr:acetyl-coenzyme A synthetase N-terminal domain-containing protein [Gemmatimonadaceae bacterium]